MSQYKILVLTDHKTHSSAESIYSLLWEMSQNTACEDVVVMSRAKDENSNFFEGSVETKPLGKSVDENYQYENFNWWYDRDFRIDIGNYDVVFLRLDRPVSNHFLDFISDTFHEKYIINDSSGIKETSSKDFLLRFPDLCPEMKLCQQLSEVEDFASRFPIVLKPLCNYGGKGLIRLDSNRAFLENEEVALSDGYRAIEEALKSHKTMLAMRFLPKVAEGDKRIVVVNGTILGSILRIPTQGSWLCNLSQGGTVRAAEIEEDEIKMVETIDPEMKARGIVIYGFDTLIDKDRRVLTEINTLNVGGLIQIARHTQKPIIKMASDLIWEYIKNLDSETQQVL